MLILLMVQVQNQNFIAYELMDLNFVVSLMKGIGMTLIWHDSQQL